MREDRSSSPTQTASAPTTIARQLLESWKDRAYREAFKHERVRSSIALQIRALREQRNMTQAELGESIGMAQAWISKLEDPEYGKMAITTLLRVADAFDTDLEVKFRAFSRALDEFSRQDSSYFIVPSFEDELPRLEQDSAITSAMQEERAAAKSPRNIHGLAGSKPVGSAGLGDKSYRPFNESAGQYLAAR
jgi:transcriptional regulator with XRE-family HTH domain